MTDTLFRLGFSSLINQKAFLPRPNAVQGRRNALLGLSKLNLVPVDLKSEAMDLESKPLRLNLVGMALNLTGMALSLVGLVITEINGKPRVKDWLTTLLGGRFFVGHKS